MPSNTALNDLFASGMQCLHTEVKPSVIHRDLNSKYFVCVEQDKGWVEFSDSVTVLHSGSAVQCVSHMEIHVHSTLAMAEVGKKER